MRKTFHTSMAPYIRALPAHRPKPVSIARCLTSSALTPYGRTAPFRRIQSELFDFPAPIPLIPSAPLAIRSPFCPLFPPLALSFTSRSFTSATRLFQQQQPKEEVRDPPRTADPSQSTSEASSDPKSSSSSSNPNEEGSTDQKQQDDPDAKDSKKQKREPPPPPPPHGDKSPWQVFTETLKSEFQASKEWTESTKALASSAHSFTENESVKRARAAYSSASSATSSATSSALKGTGKALGQSAAWTWDSAVVKGVRTGVNATGKGIEKATRPVRETSAYKSAVGGVKDVIDDGSSSRYGGWVEKEERRKQRELREAEEALKTGGTPGATPAENIEEDPKYALLPSPFPLLSNPPPPLQNTQLTPPTALAQT